MRCSAGDWLILVNIAVAYLDVEPTVWVTTDPSLVVNRRALTAEI